MKTALRYIEVIGFSIILGFIVAPLVAMFAIQ